MRRLIMNGKGKTLLLIISLAFNLGACLAVAVQGHGEAPSRSPHGGGRGRGDGLCRKLNLSPDQEAVLSAAREELFAELRVLEDRHRDESVALADLLTAPELDMEAVSAQVRKVAAVRDQIHWRMVRHLMSIREVLRPEQLESFKEFAGRVLSRSEGGRPHRGGPPGHGRPAREPEP